MVHKCPVSALLLVLTAVQRGKHRPLIIPDPALPSIRSQSMNARRSKDSGSLNFLANKRHPGVTADSEWYALNVRCRVPSSFTRTIASASTRHVFNASCTTKPSRGIIKEPPAPWAPVPVAYQRRKSPKNATGDGAMPSLQ
ncbi:hypothetical protein PISMIDRAFT_681475 [Pisolithus microcarpus 441]|uniref:Unplaced genomic scaffold scaffold_69, whole genome shotgun sequence n=1 Tax=Pisolithus microcarpus 441 TaxID=765257 RepID=A0A0C9ZN71_9AGAM|nr:hypothetical protein PISMIDRAFT_681475 [Pisolithus microcarpus 441]